MPYRAIYLLAATMLVATSANGQFHTLETDHLRLIYFGQAQSHVVKQVARSFENAHSFHRELFEWTPGEKTTVFVHDFGDYGNAGADVIPRDRISIGIAPFQYAFETAPANERLNATMNHELVHVVVAGKPAGRDVVFRRAFSGKVSVTSEDPVSMIYSYLTAPRRYAPRWYQEGIAVFLETWMAGGLGRSLGGYDEMVFRAMVSDDRPFYDFVGLESAGTAVDFQVGAISYLYGTRFMSYLALQYSPEQVIAWTSRSPGTRAYFGAQFRKVFGVSLATAWSEWVAFEKEYQLANLERISQNPVTEGRPISSNALGSVSRAHLNAEAGLLYAAINNPGQIAHVAAIDINTGSIRRIADIKGASLYSVSSVAYAPSDDRLFFTTDNNGWRGIRSLDMRTRVSRAVLDAARIGDLAYNAADDSVWGVRHDNGYSTLVRIPAPHELWNRIYTFPFGRDLYDIDVSPDGRYLTGALAEISGQQSLIRMSVDSLMAGKTSHEVLFDFDSSNPEGFVFSPDGKYLFGSSYYSGASNIYRYDLTANRMEVLTNAETGFFRPVPVSDDSLIVFRYSAEGFQPVMIANEPVQRVSAIRFLGQEVVEQHPVVRSWLAGSPGDVDLDALIVNEGQYTPLKNLYISSAYPIVRGYKNAAAVGVKLNVTEPIGLHNISLSASYSPGDVLPSDERLHASLSYSYREWSLSASVNPSDFYDLFGPTKTGRKGYSAHVGHERFLIYDVPRTLKLGLRVSGHWGLDRLPSYQNVEATSNQLYTGSATLSYQNLRSSLGAVDHEKGVHLSLTGSSNLVTERLYPRTNASFHVGTPLPMAHSSIWLRTSAGASLGERDNPYANFFFGGFGNNWVDHQAVKRYHQHYSFPGVELNALGGTNYGKALVEWNLPPLRFERLGVDRLFLQWSRMSLFGSGLMTNVDSADWRQTAVNVGGQVDFRLVMLSYLPATLSFGYSLAFTDDAFSDEPGKARGQEFMVSLKIL